jgi:hypothetical protein
MANTENKQGNPTGSSATKQNNVTEFNSSSSKTEAAKSDSSSFGTSEKSFGRQGDGITGAATATAKTLVDQAKETAGKAYEAVTDKAATKLDEQKSTLTGGLTTVADSVRQVSHNLESSKTDSGLAETAAKYTGTAAQKIEDVAGYFESRNVRDMARDLEGFARRNPALFLGAAFGLGVLVARFLKSTSPGYDSARAGRTFSAAGVDHQLPASTTSDRSSTANTSTTRNSPTTGNTSTDFSAKPL